MSLDALTPAPAPTPTSGGPVRGGEQDDTGGLAALADVNLFRDGLTFDAAAAAHIRGATLTWAAGLRDRISLAWPTDLYVPGQADYRQYWIVPPPHDHVYQWDWTHSTNPAPNGCAADNGTGYLFSTINATNLSGRNRATAGLAFEYHPTATLATVRVAADVHVTGALTYRLLAQQWGSVGYAHAEFFGTVFLLGWEINPVTHQWEELANNGRRTIFSDGSHYGQQATTSGYARSYQGSSFTCDFVVQSGRTYAFGVVFQTTINTDVRAPDDRTPYQRRPGDDIQISSYLAGSVPQMSVETRYVSIA